MMKINQSAASVKVSIREKSAFTFGIFSQNIVFAFVSAYIMIFFTDYVGISPAAVGTLMLVARLFDAINDPLMGVITEKTRTRWGKFRPYLFIVALPLLICLVLLFTNIDSTATNKLLWAYLTYILFGMIYTVSDIPLWSLTSVMTRSQDERMSIISLGKSIVPVSFVLVTVITIPLISFFGGGEAAYRNVAMIYGSLMAIGMVLTAMNTKERVEHQKETLPIKDILAFLKDNTLLRKILSCQVLIFVIDNLVTAAVIYYATYNLKDVNMAPILSLAIIVPMILGILISAKVAKKHDKKKILLISLLFRVIGYVALFFIGYDDTTLLIISLFIVAFTFGVPEILLPSMMLETIDYMEVKTGNRAEGIVWSTQTFIVKVAASLAGFALGHLLTFIEFVPNTEQTAETLSKLHAILFLAPAVLTALSIIPMLSYSLTKEKYQEITQALTLRKANIAK